MGVPFPQMSEWNGNFESNIRTPKRLPPVSCARRQKRVQVNVGWSTNILTYVSTLTHPFISISSALY